MLENLKGYKTKIGILGILMYAIGGLITGNSDANTALLLISGALSGYGIYDKIGRE